MAIKPVVQTIHNNGARTYTWSGVATGDTIIPVEMGPEHPGDILMQVSGTFAGGTSVGLEGSLDRVNYASLSDVGGTTIGLTTDGLVSVREGPLVIRPTVTGGTGDSVNISVFVRYLSD